MSQVSWKLVRPQPESIRDDSAAGYDAENRGARWTRDVASAFAPSYALSFDAADGDYAAVTGYAYEGTGYDALTVSAWIRTTADNQVVASFDRSEFWRFGVGSSAASNKLTFNVHTSNGVQDLAGNTDVNTGDWVHCVARFDAGDVTLFVDGQSDATYTSVGSTFGDSVTRYGYLGTGSESSSFDGSKGPTSYFDGDLGPVGVWHRALSDAEVADLAAGQPVDDAGLVFRYGMDAGEPSLLDVEVTDAYNRFARNATAILDDPDGAKMAEYPRPAPVELDVKREIDGMYENRFGGFVVNPQSDQDHTELELLSHDFWLRKRRVFQSFTDTAISTILNDLVVDLTPLDWVPSNVSVVNDTTISRDWKGERLDQVIAELSSISAGEEFGATDDGQFFFRPRETDTATRNFTVGEYYDADFSEDGKQEVNKVTLYYGEGSNTGAVSVQDRASQKELAEELGRPRPVVIEETKTYPEIGSEKAAERKARQIMNDRSVIQTGTLDTWEAFRVRPGDVTHVRVPDQGVDQDFRVAEITYTWQDDETEVKLAENSEGVLDTLVSLSQEVSRIDSRAADESATITQFVELAEDVGVEFEVAAYKRTVPADQLTFGPTYGGWGDPRAGGGYWGDQRGTREQLL